MPNARQIALLLTISAVLAGPAPQFDVLFENVTVEEGESAEFHCLARGDAPITYEWYNQTGEPMSVSNSENGSWLAIPEARSVHEGMYTCTAKNSHGLVSKLYYLAVVPKQGVNATLAVGEVRVLNVSATTVTLYVPVSESVPNVHFRYKESRDRAFVERQYSTTPDRTYEIGRLTPAGLYDFQFGVDGSTWSDAVHVILLPDVPELIIRRQEKGLLELEWFRRVDDIMRGTVDKHQIKYYTVRPQRLSGEATLNERLTTDCAVTIDVPSCGGSSYPISDLQRNTYYAVEVRAHTASGYGGVARIEVYMPA